MASVKQIEIDGVVYDFSDGGFSDDAKNAIITLLEKVAYVDTSGQAYLTDLYNKLFENYWSITNTLSHASNSNSAQTVEKGSSYTATISASAGYTLTGATVSVTMNGADVTSSVYSNGTISISEVTGDVVITVVAVAVALVSIEATYTQSGTVYNTDSLDDLKTDLIVTATYSDSSTAVIPSTDYTLSGSLTAGTSTITVTVGEETDTFSVTVTTGFLYTSDKGLLSEMSYATITKGTNCVEEISNGKLRLYIPNNSAEIKYALTPTSCASGTMKARVKINNIGYSAGSQYFRMIVGDGSSKSAASGFYEVQGDSTKIRVGYSVGSTGTATSTDYVKADWHDIEVIFDGSKQTVKVDGSTVVSNANPATNSALLNCIMRLAGTNYKTSEILLESLEFTAA